MKDRQAHEAAREPEDLARFFVQRANLGDVDGLLALYEPTAVMATQAGRVAVGTAELRTFFEQLLLNRPLFAPGVQAPALRRGDLALTSSRLADGQLTAEVARRQADGSWRWLIDQPALGREGPHGGNRPASRRRRFDAP